MHGFKVFTVAATLLSLLGPLLAKRIIVCERCGLEHRLRSPAFGINLDTESMTAGIKYADGSLGQLAKIKTSDELRTLFIEWAREPIAVVPGDSFDDKSPDRVHLTSEAEVLYKSLATLVDEISINIPKFDLQHQYYALSLPAFVNRRHFCHVRQAASKTGLMTNHTGWVDHSDRVTHGMYNILFCTYHIHPHDPLCAEARPEGGVFDTLVVDYSSSILTVTWLETSDPYNLRRGGFADGELGGRSVRDSKYWARMQASVAALVRSIKNDKKSSLKFGPNQLIFLGELGMDELLRAFLRDALAGTRFAFGNVTIHDSYDPVFASALSTAFTAKAVMDAPDPRHCNERLKCEELRERVYHEAVSSARDEL